MPSYLVHPVEGLSPNNIYNIIFVFKCWYVSHVLENWIYLDWQIHRPASTPMDLVPAYLAVGHAQAVHSMLKHNNHRVDEHKEQTKAGASN